MKEYASVKLPDGSIVVPGDWVEKLISTFRGMEWRQFKILSIYRRSNVYIFHCLCYLPHPADSDCEVSIRCEGDIRKIGVDRLFSFSDDFDICSDGDTPF